MPLWRTASRKSNQDASDSASMNQNDATASASAAAGTEWLSGQLHHLTPEQEGKLTEFKKFCEDKGYYKADIGDGSGKPSYEDETMLRFLRARKFDVEAAWGQFKDTEDWRRDNALDKLYENIDVDSYESARRMYPQWTGRRDHRGIPVYVFEIKHLNSQNMAAYTEKLKTSNIPEEAKKTSTVPERMLRLFALYENLLNFVMPLCSTLRRPHPETPIVASNNIVDVSGVGLKQFWNLKGHMQDASVLATAHYPETLDRIFIIGAPSFFPTVWSWIKRWFDPGTTSKIFILTPNEVKPTLSSFMDISNIPKCYGGELDWQWGDMPNLDDDARSVIAGVESASPSTDKEREGRTESGYLKGPMLFNTEKSRVDVLGKVKGESRRLQIPVSLDRNEQSDTTASSSSVAAATTTTTTANTPTTAATTPSEEKTEGDAKAAEAGADATAAAAPAAAEQPAAS